jgi:hypothetical protein
VALVAAGVGPVVEVAKGAAVMEGTPVSTVLKKQTDKQLYLTV